MDKERVLEIIAEEKEKTRIEQWMLISLIFGICGFIAFIIFWAARELDPVLFGGFALGAVTIGAFWKSYAIAMNEM